MYKKVSLFQWCHLLSIQVMFLFLDWGSFISKSENNRKMAQYSLRTQINNCNIQSFHFINRVWVSVCWSLLALVISMMTGSRKKFSNFHVYTHHQGKDRLLLNEQVWSGAKILPLDNLRWLVTLALGNSSWICLRIKAWANSEYLSFHVVLALSKQVSLFANKTDFVAKEILFWVVGFCFPATLIGHKVCKFRKETELAMPWQGTHLSGLCNTGITSGLDLQPYKQSGTRLRNKEMKTGYSTHQY